MRILVTGSAGHLGEALVCVLGAEGHDVVGLDVLASPSTSVVGSIVDRVFVRRCLRRADAIVHTATLHKPHIGSRARQQFVDTNVTGTLNLLEGAVAAGVGSFVFTSSTSVFGRALTPPPGAPAAWITEDVAPIPRNVYGATKNAAEDLCELIHHDCGMPCVILRTSRFFPEPDDRAEIRSDYTDANAKANELLYRRIDLSGMCSIAFELGMSRVAHWRHQSAPRATQGQLYLSPNGVHCRPWTGIVMLDKLVVVVITCVLSDRFPDPGLRWSPLSTLYRRLSVFPRTTTGFAQRMVLSTTTPG